MRRLLQHWFYLFQATIWLVAVFVRAARYFDTKLWRDLALPPSAVLTSKEKRRLQHYFYGTTYLSVIFCSLRQRPRTHREKHLFVNLAALAYFFDDLVDAFRQQDDSGVLWQDNPEAYGAVADERGLALHFLDNIRRALPPHDWAQFRTFMHAVFNVETTGRQQQNTGLTLKDLQRITADKGGYSALLFRRVLRHELSAVEQQAIYDFGHLIQLCDDIFDLWFDHQSGTATVATYFTAEQRDLKGLQQVFETQVAATRQSFLATPYPRRQQEVALRVVHYIVALTQVCLHHYADLERRLGQLPLTDRTAMVVDMERWRNRIRAAWALLSFGF
jgi:hypothetical protein